MQSKEKIRNNIYEKDNIIECLFSSKLVFNVLKYLSIIEQDDVQTLKNINILSHSINLNTKRSIYKLNFAINEQNMRVTKAKRFVIRSDDYDRSNDETLEFLKETFSLLVFDVPVNLDKDILLLKDLSKYRELRKVCFCNEFNESIDDLSTSCITHLTLGGYFNKPIDHLPSSLKVLTLGREFNQPIDNLPSFITHLTLGWRSNQRIDKLPSSITHLKLGYYFDQSIDNLPTSITHLTLSKKFDLSKYNLAKHVIVKFL
jgi:hypothetical protein